MKISNFLKILGILYPTIKNIASTKNEAKYESALFNKLNINQAKGKFKFKVGQSNLENKNEISNGRTKYSFQIYSILRKKSFLDFDISNKQVNSKLFS